MFKEQYKQLCKLISPTESLLEDTICQVKELESEQKKHSIWRPVVALVSVCLCVSVAMPVLAATVEPIFQLMYMVSPTIAQLFVPVQMAHEDNGIKMEVVSAYIHDSIAEIYITLQDLTENRIDETTDLYDSYSIHRPFGSSAHCERVGYDPNTKTATFLIVIEEWGNKNIEGDKITFTVREFLSHKTNYDDIEIPIALSSVEVAKDTHGATNIVGASNIEFEQFNDFEENPPTALVPSSPISGFPVDGIDLTGIGYIDGKLHIQTSVKDNLDKDNHGFFYLKDSNGHKVNCSYTFSYVNQYERPGRISYDNYVFDIPQSAIANYSLYGDFVTSGMITKGNWKVTFPLNKR